MRVLVIYYYDQYPLRASAFDHLMCFKRYINGDVEYVNMAIRSLPKKLDYDLIIFTTMFLSRRWRPQQFELLMKKIEPLESCSIPKVAIPQDEFIHMDLLCEFISRFDCKWVFTPVSKQDWHFVFNKVDHDRVFFRQVLTGYVEPQTVKKIEAMKQKIKKDIDISYRVWKAPYWMGRHGIQKVIVAEEVLKSLPRFQLKTDISLKTEDTLMGSDWYRLLLRSRYTLGAESGASLCQRQNELLRLTNDFLEQNPNADFNLVEQTCFPNRDGELNLFSVGPRHFEACITETCQILVEGNYENRFVADRHYIPVKKDFSDLDLVLEKLNDEDHRIRLTRQAYEEVIMNPNNHYSSFVGLVLSDVFDAETASRSVLKNAKPLYLDLYGQKDLLSWMGVATRWTFLEKPKRKFKAWSLS